MSSNVSNINTIIPLITISINIEGKKWISKGAEEETGGS